MTDDDQTRVLEFAATLADLARTLDGAVVWPPQPDGPSYADFVVDVGGQRFVVTVEEGE